MARSVTHTMRVSLSSLQIVLSVIDENSFVNDSDMRPVYYSNPITVSTTAHCKQSEPTPGPRLVRTIVR